MVNEHAQNNLDHFKERAAQWDEKPQRVELAKSVAAAIIERIPLYRQMNVLEIGCGTGLVTLEIAGLVGHVTGVDTSPDMLGVFEQKLSAGLGDNISLHNMDLQQNDLSRTFDLIYSSMTFHHIQDVEALLRRCAGMLNPEGHIAIADLDEEDGSFHPDSVGVNHFGFSQESITAYLRNIGLTEVDWQIVHAVERPDKEGNMRDYPVFLVSGRKNR